LDAKGGGLYEDLAEGACLRAVNNFGFPGDMYLATDAHSYFSRQFYAKGRTQPDDTRNASYLVPGFDGSLSFNFKPSVFFRGIRRPLSTAVSTQSAPTLSDGGRSAAAGSKFTSADAGDYSYKISAVYADGETLPSSKL